MCYHRRSGIWNRIAVLLVVLQSKERRTEMVLDNNAIYTIKAHHLIPCLKVADFRALRRNCLVVCCIAKRNGREGQKNAGVEDKSTRRRFFAA